MATNKKEKKADLLIQQINIHLKQMKANIQYLWLHDNILYIQLLEHFDNSRERERIQNVLALLIKEDLNFITTIQFIVEQEPPDQWKEFWS